MPNLFIKFIWSYSKKRQTDENEKTAIFFSNARALSARLPRNPALSETIQPDMVYG